MRRFLPLLFAALALLGVQAHAVGPVISTSTIKADVSDNTTNVTTNAVTVANGDLVAIHACSHNANSTNYTLSDSQGNALTPLISTAFQGTIIAGRITTTKATAGSASYTVTANKGGSNMGLMIAVIVVQAGTWDGTTPNDGIGAVTAGTGTNSTVALPATALSTDLLLATVCGGDDNGVHGFVFGTAQTGMTTNASWTMDQTTGRYQSQTMSKSGSANQTVGYPSMTNGSGRDWVTMGWAVKDVSGGGGGGSHGPFTSPIILGAAQP